MNNGSQAMKMTDRKVYKMSEAALTVERLLVKKEPVLLVGPPGIGKTSLGKQIAKKLHIRILFFLATIKQPHNISGIQWVVKDEDGNVVAHNIPIGEMRELFETEEPLIALWDDIGQALPMVQAALLEPILENSIGGRPLSPHVRHMACTNRKDDLAGVSLILEPLKSRFTIIELMADLSSWVDWALQQPKFPLELIAACRWKPEWIQVWKPSDKIENSPNPRNIEAIGRNWDEPRSVLEIIIYGRMGLGPGMELIEFIDFYQDLPNPMEVIKSPTTTRLPEKAGHCWAMMGAFANMIDPTNVDAIITYMDRWNENNLRSEEYQMALLHDSMDKINETEAFHKWALKNTHIWQS